MGPFDTAISRASVKVMRSHDYCHFEVVLGVDDAAMTDADVDEIRKRAARLADKAVEQYKIAKRDAEIRQSAAADMEHDWRRAQYEGILQVPESERTPAQKATVKAWKDAVFHANRAPYDYEDDWRDSDDEEDDQP